VVGRLGGEEFVALLPSTLAEASIAAERVRAALAAASFVRNGQRVTATVSIGVSSGSPMTAVDLLITRADDALYRAKANGRNRVETAEEVAATPEASPQDGSDPTQRKSRRKEEGAVNNDAPESCIA
jgi:predicted signal transduction protein with EAL and GGDEF domain